MIGIIDYGMGNIFSLQGALKRLNIPNELTSNIEDLDKYKALILPGVGAFKDAIENLKELKLDKALKDWTEKGRPLLGICLGMQLLFEESYEYGYFKGLGFLPGKIEKIPAGLKVPHMGWNLLNKDKESYLFKDITEGYVYFVHSYYAKDAEKVTLASTQYNTMIPAVVGQKNILGMQFHPEKSGQTGLKLLKNWYETIN